MDNPGITLFSGPNLQINNSRNVEEEEDLEDQLRRREELQNLLQAKIEDFHYDESTVNSSVNTSVASQGDQLEHMYKEANTPSDQLKILYDVRCRELQALREEYEKYKLEASKQLDSQKHKNILLEAELRQLGVSLKNSENLLVEKNDAARNLTAQLEARDAKINGLEKLVHDYETEISTCKSELSEVYLKLQTQNGPLSSDAKHNSEELRISLNSKIEKLESAYSELERKLEFCNTEKQALQDEVHRLHLEKVALEQDNNLVLSNFDSAQQQCKELIDIIEALKYENEFFKGRLEEYQRDKSITFENSKETTANEKLRKMLVDKTTELDTLKIQLRHFHENMKELTEYRQLKCDIYKKEFQNCDNRSHTKELLLLQNELHNYQRIIEDKSQQIVNLNLNNKDLKEKIEEMLLQTRNELQNISSKYNVPQLEVMRKELEKAEANEKMLNERLKESEEKQLSLLQKLKSNSHGKDTETVLDELDKCRKDLKEMETMFEAEKEQNCQLTKQVEDHKIEVLKIKSQLEELKNLCGKTHQDQAENVPINDDFEELKMQLKNVVKHLEKDNTKSHPRNSPEMVLEIKSQMASFMQLIKNETIEKGLIEEKINSWIKLLDQIEADDTEELLKNQYREAVMNLHETEEKFNNLNSQLVDLKNTMSVLEQEKQNLSIELKNSLTKLLHSENSKNVLEKEVECLRKSLNENNKLENTEAQIDILQKEIQNLRDQLKEKEKDMKLSLQTMKRFEQEKKDTKKWLDKVKKEFEKLKEVNIKLESELQQKRDYSKDNENKENTTSNNIEEELLQAELKLRDELQIEYQKRLNDIEKRYQATFKETSELCKLQKAELENQDKKFREYLKEIIAECEAATDKLENEKLTLAKQIRVLCDELTKFKATVATREQKYRDLMKKIDKESQKSNQVLKQWSKKVASTCSNLHEINRKANERMFASMERYDQEIATIQRHSDAKIAKKSLKLTKAHTKVK